MSLSHSKNKALIFTNKINTNYKLIPFNDNNDIGKTKYLPASSKEWKNSIYSFNKNNMKNLPVYDLNINSLIKNYFNLYFNNNFIEHKYISRKLKRKSFNKIFVSRAEVKHTNSKAIITIYVYNQEKIKLLKKINKLKLSLFKNLLSLLIINKNFTNNSNLLSLVAFNKINFLKLKYIPKKLYKQLSLIRRYKLRLNLNNSKFEEKFLYKLSKLISKYYNKKVEFNIVRLKSIAYNSDIFTEILTLKLRSKVTPMRRMTALLGKVMLPVVNTIIEKGRIEKSKDLELLDNKYKNLNISSIIKEGTLNNNTIDSLNKLIYNAYYDKQGQLDLDTSRNTRNNDLLVTSKTSSSANSLRNIIMNSIKYKNMGGVRLIVKGRLTRRYRADRAVYKLRWKGGLKNIDSSYKGLSSVIFRGYQGSNVEHSMFVSKRRIGSFAVKGWFSGK